MIIYLVKRLVYAIPIVIGVNLLTFVLFFMVNTPDDMARVQLGAKRISAEQITQWKQVHGFDKPLFYNAQQSGIATLTDTLFYTKSMPLLTFDLGKTLQGRAIADDLAVRMWPSLAIAVPTLVLGLLVNVGFALFAILFRDTWFDFFGVMLCVVLMSISGLFYIILGQYLLAKSWQWLPISGYQGGWQAWRFVLLPVIVGMVSGVGAGVRWYRSILLEEIHKEYVRTARAKGLSEWRVLSRHVLKNGMLPIVTGLVVIIPSLFLGSLIMESFFGIPGLGSYTIDAIHAQDFDVVRVMTYIGTLLYIVGLIATDVVYTLVDPRVRLQGLDA